MALRKICWIILAVLVLDQVFKVYIKLNYSLTFYGSDAIGGVMTFKTKDPVLSRKDKVMVIGNAYSRYFSAASGFASNAHVSVGNKKLGSLTSFTYSSFGDLRQGSKRLSIADGFGERNWYVSRVNGVDSMLENSDSNLHTRWTLDPQFSVSKNSNQHPGMVQN